MASASAGVAIATELTCVYALLEQMPWAYFQNLAL
jgi:hypothetical protein